MVKMFSVSVFSMAQKKVRNHVLLRLLLVFLSLFEVTK